MKKLFISAFSLVVGTTMLIGCSNNDNQEATDTVNTSTQEEYVSQLFEELKVNDYTKLDLDLGDLAEFRRLPISQPIEDSLTNLQYEIIGSTETNNLAQVDVTISATPLGYAFDQALENFLEESAEMGYIFTERSKFMLFEELFLEAYNDKQNDAVTNTVTVYLERELEGLNYTWELTEYNGYFADAVLGGLLTSMSPIAERPFNPEHKLEFDDLFDIDDLFERRDFDDIMSDRLAEIFD